MASFDGNEETVRVSNDAFALALNVSEMLRVNKLSLNMHVKVAVSNYYYYYYYNDHL